MDIFINDNITRNLKNKIKFYMDLENVWVWIKKIFILLTIFAGAYLTPMYAQGLAILIFILVDLGTGMWASKKLNVEITSKRLRDSVSKFIAYGVALIISVIFKKEFGVDILTVVAFGLASIEITSIFENLTKITNIKFVHWIRNMIKPKTDQFEKKEKR